MKVGLSALVSEAKLNETPGLAWTAAADRPTPRIAIHAHILYTGSLPCLLLSVWVLSLFVRAQMHPSFDLFSTAEDTSSSVAIKRENLIDLKMSKIDDDRPVAGRRIVTDPADQTEPRR